MKKLFYLFLLAPVLSIVACGEAGVESDISKITEISFTASANQLNGATGQTNTESVNFAAEEFEEFVGDAKNFTLNELAFEISDLDNPTSATLSFDLRVDFTNSADANDGQSLLSLQNAAIANGNRIVLFDKNGGGAANASVVQSLENAILNGETVQIEISATKNGEPLTEDFVLTFFWDLTARVDLD